MTGQRPLQGMRIGLLTASASRTGAGVFEAVLQQAAMIRALGGEAAIFALHDAHSDTDAVRFLPSKVTTFPVFGPRQFGYAPGLVEALIDAELDLLHLHGIWMYPSRAAKRWRDATQRSYVISPHGMLAPWVRQRNRWKKAAAEAVYERASWREATLLHALTAEEARDIAAAVAADHVTVTIGNPAPPRSAETGQSREREVLYLGRIHEKKNLLALVAGWNEACLAGWRLTIAGWGEADEIARLRAAIGPDHPGIAFVGAVYGAEKQGLLERARFTILPSFSEGLPMSVLEGWAAATPAIISPHCHLPEGIAAGAALACETDQVSIAAALRQAAAMNDDQWQAMSRAGVALVEGPFSAQTVAARWARAYRGESLE